MNTSTTKSRNVLVRDKRVAGMVRPGMAEVKNVIYTDSLPPISEIIKSIVEAAHQIMATEKVPKAAQLYIECHGTHVPNTYKPIHTGQPLAMYETQLTFRGGYRPGRRLQLGAEGINRDNISCLKDLLNKFEAIVLLSCASAGDNSDDAEHLHELQVADRPWLSHMGFLPVKDYLWGKYLKKGERYFPEDNIELWADLFPLRFDGYERIDDEFDERGLIDKISEITETPVFAFDKDQKYKIWYAAPSYCQIFEISCERTISAPDEWGEYEGRLIKSDRNALGQRVHSVLPIAAEEIDFLNKK